MRRVSYVHRCLPSAAVVFCSSRGGSNESSPKPSSRSTATNSPGPRELVVCRPPLRPPPPPPMVLVLVWTAGLVCAAPVSCGSGATGFECKFSQKKNKEPRGTGPTVAWKGWSRGRCRSGARCLEWTRRVCPPGQSKVMLASCFYLPSKLLLLFAPKEDMGRRAKMLKFTPP